MASNEQSLLTLALLVLFAFAVLLVVTGCMHIRRALRAMRHRAWLREHSSPLDAESSANDTLLATLIRIAESERERNVRVAATEGSRPWCASSTDALRQQTQGARIDEGESAPRTTAYRRALAAKRARDPVNPVAERARDAAGGLGSSLPN